MTLFRSLSFRLALLYLAVFVGSVSSLGGAYYWAEVARPLAAVRHDIVAEAASLRALYRERGEDALAGALEQRAAAGTPRIAYHALLDARGDSITANLPSWPHLYAPGWKRIEADVAREGDEDEYEALVLDQQLSAEVRLLLGRDIDDIDELEESFQDTVIWIVPALLILGVLGGALMSRVIAARLNAISGAARGVIDGDLSSRIAVRGSGDDFDRLAATLNLMLDRLERSIESVRRVSDSVAHELRTPVTRLQATLAELRDGKAGNAGDALAEADRLQTVIDAILRVSRIEGGRREIALRSVDLPELLADVVEFYQPEVEARNQRLSVEVTPGTIISGDRDLLFQGLANLLDNAVKFTPRDGSIELRAIAERGTATVEVKDSGPGVAPEHLDRLTERFFRAPAMGEVSGLGLGLSVVAAVAAAHRSDLTFASDAGGLRVAWTFAQRG